MHLAGTLLGAAVTAFLASFVEFIEALSVVLAVGAARGWRPAVAGAGAAAVVLGAMLAVLGPAIGPPSSTIRLIVGVLSLLFGLRWLRKAILRAAGRMKLRDEAASYARARDRLGAARGVAWDAAAAGAAFQVVLIEGIEVVFIVAATAAAGGRLMPAALGAGLALLTVIALGVMLHRPITSVPENTLKFAVGIMMSAFGVSWTAEALGAAIPGGLAVTVVVVASAALLLVRVLRPATLAA
jgi:uncharacterized membrane protein